VRFLEVQDSRNHILVYVEQSDESPTARNGRSVPGADPPAADPPGQRLPATGQATTPAIGDDYLGRVIVGMSDDAFSQRQQEIVIKAGILALFALLFTFLLARRLALSLSKPISDMGHAVKAIQQGDYNTPCRWSMTANWATWRGTSTTWPAPWNRPAMNRSRPLPN
jgi:hypothetical protein